MAENAVDNAHNDEPTAKQAKRGAGFSKMEDLLVSRAFIAASEDPILGTSQKGKDFKKTMHERYKLLLKEQQRMDQVKYSGSSESTREILPDLMIYDQRSPDSIYN
jgi:hypothetical protein